MSQASSSTARTRRSARVAPLAIVRAAAPLPTAADVEPMEDDVTGLPLIMCLDCRDVRVFAATTTQSKCNNGKRYFKCPRKNFSNVSAVVQFAFCPNFIYVCSNFIACCCRLDAGEM